MRRRQQLVLLILSGVAVPALTQLPPLNFADISAGGSPLDLLSRTIGQYGGGGIGGGPEAVLARLPSPDAVFSGIGANGLTELAGAPYFQGYQSAAQDLRNELAAAFGDGGLPAGVANLVNFQGGSADVIDNLGRILQSGGGPGLAQLNIALTEAGGPDAVAAAFQRLGVSDGFGALGLPNALDVVQGGDVDILATLAQADPNFIANLGIPLDFSGVPAGGLANILPTPVEQPVPHGTQIPVAATEPDCEPGCVSGITCDASCPLPCPANCHPGVTCPLACASGSAGVAVEPPVSRLACPIGCQPGLTCPRSCGPPVHPADGTTISTGPIGGDDCYEGCQPGLSCAPQCAALFGRPTGRPAQAAGGPH